MLGTHGCIHVLFVTWRCTTKQQRYQFSRYISLYHYRVATALNCQKHYTSTQAKHMMSLGLWILFVWIVIGCRTALLTWLVASSSFCERSGWESSFASKSDVMCTLDSLGFPIHAPTFIHQSVKYDDYDTKWLMHRLPTRSVNVFEWCHELVKSWRPQGFFDAEERKQQEAWPTKCRQSIHWGYAVLARGIDWWGTKRNWMRCTSLSQCFTYFATTVFLTISCEIMWMSAFWQDRNAKDEVHQKLQPLQA